jgi:hypothetical protein
VFLPTGEPGSWDGGFVTTASQIVFDESEAKIYYSGRDSLHHVPGRRNIGLATVPRDRFVALTPASEAEAWIEIEVHAGVEQLYINADAGNGALRVEWLRSSPSPGTPEEGRREGSSGVSNLKSEISNLKSQIPGAITGDSLDHAIAVPGGTPSRLRIHLRGNARLFAIRWPRMNGASVQ